MASCESRGYSRCPGIDHPGTTADESYTYFADGALKTASTTDGGTWTYGYNKRRLPTSESLALGGKTFALGTGYTGLGHVSTLSYPSGLSVSFNPNALGQPRQAGTYASAATYHPNGSLAGFTYGNGLTHSRSLNARGLPLHVRDTFGASARLDYQYAYDKHGNPTQVTDYTTPAPWNETRSLAYDARDRMIQATAPNIYGVELYEYDPLDNVRRMAGLPNGQGGYAVDFRFQYDASQRITGINDPGGAQQWGFTLNTLGETLTRAGQGQHWSYQWNAAGRMTRADRIYAGSTWETYVYDAHGHRSRSTRNTGTTRHQVYSRAGQLLYTEDTKDNQRIDYVYLGNKLVAQRSRPISTSTATITWHHTDHLGSANLETNAAGTQTLRTIRMPYGSPYDGQYREGPGYAGHVTDTQTNLTYMQQRYYDPVALRFLSPDPVDVSPTNGSNFNRYWYANNNPYRFVDPDGRYSCEGSKKDCAKIDRYVDKIRTASKSHDLKPSERAQVRIVSNYLGKKGEGGPKIVSATLPKNTSARTDQRGNIEIDVNKKSKGTDPVTRGAMALGHEAQHDVDASANGEAHTREVATQRERNAYGTEALIGRANGVFLSPSDIDAAVKGSIENAFGPEPEWPDEDR